MPYHSTIPQPGDAKSVSQGQILDNFTYLNDLVLGKNNFIILPEQAAAPATTATQMALYTKHVGAKPAMFLRELSSGTEVDFTTAGKTDPGWCKLPCGIIMKWGQVGLSNAGSQPVVYPVAAGIPVFSNVYSVQISIVYTDGDTIGYVVSYANTTSFNAQSKDVRTGGHNKAATITYLAIGD
jgi:hypothetical protein